MDFSRDEERGESRMRWRGIPGAGWLLAGCTALFVFLTRWPLRSSALFSWDSANFALALEHIDIARHQPHPPGYLGYVWLGRVLLFVTDDPNVALVMWNIVATALAAVVLSRFAWEMTSDPAARMRAAATAAVMLVTGPLLWFYGTVAEIYASELLITLLMAFTAWRTVNGSPRSIYWCVATVVLGSVFKVSAAVLMIPLVVFAWTRAGTPHRWRSVLLLLPLLSIAAYAFLIAQPDLPTLTWQQLTSSTSDTRMLGGDARPLRALNRNLRDFLIAMVSGIGPFNVFALIVLAFTRYRLPARLGMRTALLWSLPWLVMLLTVHIAKPGYVLPLVPLVVLILTAWYVRLGRGAQIVLVTVQAASSIAMFLWLAPPSEATSGGTRPYRSKTFVQKMVSDLQSVTIATAHTVRVSDERVRQLGTLVTSTCPSGDPIIIAGDAIVDWRRVMWYFPRSTAINLDGRKVLFSAREKQMTPVTAAEQTFSSVCPIIWLYDGRDLPAWITHGEATLVPGLGALSRPGRLVVTPVSVGYSQ